MKNSKHTPGPWTAYHTGKRFRIDDTDGCMVASIEHVATGDEERILEPNAHLIAAAPEMLMALEASKCTCVVTGARGTMGMVLEEKTKKVCLRCKAIAKAKGGV